LFHTAVFILMRPLGPREPPPRLGGRVSSSTGSGLAGTCKSQTIP